MKQSSNPDEETVLEYLQASLRKMREGQVEDLSFNQAESSTDRGVGLLRAKSVAFSLFAFILILLGQLSIEFSKTRSLFPAWLFFALALLCTGIAWKRGESFQIEEEGSQSRSVPVQASKGQTRLQLWWFFASLSLGAASFLLFSDGKLSLLSFGVWAGAIVCAFIAFWQREERAREQVKERLRASWKTLLGNRALLLLLLVVISLTLFFQFEGLKSLPPELVSSQVDSFQTVEGILQGDRGLLFPRNVVAEPLTYYYAAFWARLLPGGLSVGGMRLSYALALCLGLLFIYKFGSLLGGRCVGLLAAGLCGLGYWPFLQARALTGGGLVLPILSASLYFFFKWLKRSDRNAVLLAGFLGGLGLLTHKIFWLLDLVYLAVLGLALLLRALRRQTKGGDLLTGLAFVLFFLLGGLPVLRVVSLNFDSFWAGELMRMQGEGGFIWRDFLPALLKGWGQALAMPFWLNRSSWVDGISMRGALDGLSAVLFLFGLSRLIVAYWQTKDPLKLLLLVLYPLMLLPSALGTAFPAENPSLARALGATVPVYLISALSLGQLLDDVSSLFSKFSARVYSWGALAMLLLVFALNMNLLYGTYQPTYTQSAWNTGEMASLVQKFEREHGTGGQVYLLGYPYWADARAVAIQAGYPQANYALDPLHLAQTAEVVGPKFFLLNGADSSNLARLIELYPQGMGTVVQCLDTQKNFIIFLIDNR